MGTTIVSHIGYLQVKNVVNCVYGFHILLVEEINWLMWRALPVDMLVLIVTIILGLDTAVHSNVFGREFGMIVATFYFFVGGRNYPYFFATLFSQILAKYTLEVPCHPLR
jgi:hypothetical protein